MVKRKSQSIQAVTACVGAGALALAAMCGGAARAAPAIAVVVRPALDAPMRFERFEADFCPPQGCILARGRIERDTHEEFTRKMRALGVQPGAELLLESAGGDVVGALKFGLKIRKAALHTRLLGPGPSGGGVCASACAYAFLGGVQRTVDHGGRLGVHQFSREPDIGPPLDAAESQRMVAVIADYIVTVGADLRLQTLALRTPASQVHWLSGYELKALSVVTKDGAEDMVKTEGDRAALATPATASHLQPFASRDS